VFGLGCDSTVRHSSARLAEGDWSPYRYVVADVVVAAAVVAEDPAIALMEGKENQSCRSGSRDMVRGLGDSEEGSCIARWRVTVMGMKLGSDNSQVAVGGTEAAVDHSTLMGMKVLNCSGDDSRDVDCFDFAAPCPFFSPPFCKGDAVDRTRIFVVGLARRRRTREEE